MSRTKNAIKNSAFGIMAKIINLIFAFVTRTVFIYILGSTYLGVNGLFTEMLSLLSFAELGFGTAMTFSMYKPIADKDEGKIIQLLDFYKKVYRVIALIIAIVGICLVPFIGYIVKGAEWLSVRELKIYFLIFLLNTVVGYFVTYKYTFVNALQKSYVTNNIDTLVIIVSYISQTLIILIFKNFMYYLLINSFILVVSRAFIIKYLDKKFPILKEKASVSLDKEEKRVIYNEVKGLAVHQFASAAVHSTDNLIISSMISVITVGLISNYNMLINSVLGFVVIIFNSVIAGFGNLAAESTVENFRKVFKEINFLNFWIYGFCSIAFFILIPPFITLWIGSDKLIDTASFALIILNCYLQGQCTVYNNARIAKGDFNKDKWWAIVQAIVNLVVSYIGAMTLGLIGVYIGTIASRAIYVLFRPYSTYRFLFAESSLIYYKSLIKHLGIVIIAAGVTCFAVNFFMTEVTVVRFIISVIIVAVLPNAIFLIFNLRSNELKLWKDRLMSIKGRITLWMT